MAENSPGQVFSPQGGSDPSDEPKPAPAPQEVAASIPRNPEPAPATPVEQPPEPKLPSPQAESAPQPAAPVNAAQPPAYAPEQPASSSPSPPAAQPAAPAPESAPVAPFQEAAAEENDYQPYDPNQEVSQQDEESIGWTASEYIAHHKSSLWFLLLAVAAIVATALVYLVTRDIISTAVIPLLALVFGMYAHRQPQEQHYELNNKGVVIGHRTHRYSDLKSFSILDEGPFSSIVFMPLKRFKPMLSIYYDPADEQRIVEFLAARLPMEQRGHDVFDRAMKRIRF